MEEILKTWREWRQAKAEWNRLADLSWDDKESALKLEGVHKKEVDLYRKVCRLLDIASMPE